MRKISLEQEPIIEGVAYLFINFDQALKFGHVGWGFLHGPGHYVYGSTDHLWRGGSYLNLPAVYKYMKVHPADSTDWWIEEGDETSMFHSMKRGKHVTYQAYKRVIVSSASPELARKQAERTRHIGWQVLDNNCVHHCDQIIRAYGAGNHLPNPSQPKTNCIPRKWFGQILGETTWL